MNMNITVAARQPLEKNGTRGASDGIYNKLLANSWKALQDQDEIDLG
jgi:hypothetical protein